MCDRIIQLSRSPGSCNDRPTMHNIGGGQVLQDILFTYEAVTHFHYDLN